MYLCICNGLTEKRVKDVARKIGSTRPSVVYRALGCKPQCGLCVEHVRHFIADTLGATVTDSSGQISGQGLRALNEEAPVRFAAE